MPPDEQTLQDVLRRLTDIERKLDAHFAEYEDVKRLFKKHYTNSNIIGEKTLERLNSHGEHFKMLYGVVNELGQAIFPERYVKGAAPNLRLSLDPEKLV